MKKFLALALMGLMATSAQALNIYMVALSGPNAYTSGVPTLANGSVGPNSSGGGMAASAGGPGIVVLGPSATARMGLVIELFNGTWQDTGAANPNQLSTATIFFNQIAGSNANQGVLNIIDLANVELAALNNAGALWHTEAYSTGMVEWVTDIRNGLPNTVTAPLIEDYHLISFDDTASCPQGSTCGGNSFAGRNLWLHTAITVHAKANAVLGQEARVSFDQGLSEFFNNSSQAYGAATTAPTNHGGNSASAPGGLWFAVNGRVKNNAFPIEVSIPEPASLALLALGGMAILRRRVK